MKKIIAKFFIVSTITALVSVLWPNLAWGAEGDTHSFSQSLEQLLNNNASIASINIDQQSYPVKKVVLSYRYNKTITNAVTISVSVGGTSWGSQYSSGTGSGYSTLEFTGDAKTGAIVISFTNNTGSGTGHGTFYVNNVELTEGASVPSYTISAQSNNTDYGTVSLNGSVITGAPKSGYRYASPSYSVDPANSATVVQNGNEFTVTPSANTTVTINFEAIPTHTATFSVNGNTTSQTVAEGAVIPFPNNPASISGKSFVGWVTASIDTPTDTEPTFVVVAEETMSTDDITYYAVFATAEEGDPVETKSQTLQYDTWSYSGSTTDKTTYRLFHDGGYVESTAFDLSKLSKVIVYGGTFGGDSYNSLTIGDGTNTWKSVTVSGSSQTGTNTYTGGTALTGTKKLRVASTCGSNSGNGTGVRISKVEIYTTVPSVVYSGYSTSVELAAVETPEITVASEFSISTSVVISCATDGASIYYTTNGDDPTSSSTQYTGSFNITSTTTIKAIAIKGGDNSLIATKTATKVLATPTVTIDANGLYNRNLYLGTIAGKLAASVTYNENAVDGATVSWSGNNNEVATINSSTGAVTLIKAGTVTFTATFEETSDYSEQTAEYVLTVTDADPSIATITFGSATGSTNINSASKKGTDSNGNEWTITTVGTSSFTANSGYAQVGSGSSPATSITFETTLREDVKITSLSAKFGGFNGTAGTVTLKVGDSTVGSGSLNASSDVTVSSSSSAVGKVLTVTVTGISKGVKCYFISYKVESVNAVPSESRFWSSFYNSSKSYKLPIGAQAFTMHDDKNLYLLGEDGSIIPKGTAVIIISDKASNALTECTTSIADSDNILEGSDTAYTIPTDKVAYVLGIAGIPAKIGFYKYEGNTIPGGKAYILVNK